MKLTIKRSQWLRGEGPEKSALLRPADGKMCCLGFLAVSLDATKQDIENQISPAEAPQIKWPEGFIKTYRSHNSEIKYTNDACAPLMEVNDNSEEDFTEAEREAELTQLFKKLDIEVEFVD